MLIAPAADRMKAGHDIAVNRGRRKERPGGDLERLDPIGRGRVQILRAPNDEAVQAVLAVSELQRLSKLSGDDWDWGESGGDRPHVAPTWARPELL